MTRKKIFNELTRWYKKSMINQILRGAKPIRLDYAKILDDEGFLPFDTWKDIAGYVKKLEYEEKQKKASTK